MPSKKAAPVSAPSGFIELGPQQKKLIEEERPLFENEGNLPEDVEAKLKGGLVTLGELVSKLENAEREYVPSAELQHIDDVMRRLQEKRQKVYHREMTQFLGEDYPEAMQKAQDILDGIVQVMVQNKQNAVKVQERFIRLYHAARRSGKLNEKDVTKALNALKLTKDQIDYVLKEGQKRMNDDAIEMLLTKKSSLQRKTAGPVDWLKNNFNKLLGKFKEFYQLLKSSLSGWQDVNSALDELEQKVGASKKEAGELVVWKYEDAGDYTEEQQPTLTADDLLPAEDEDLTNPEEEMPPIGQEGEDTYKEMTGQQPTASKKKANGMKYNAEYFEELLGDLQSQIESNNRSGIMRLRNEFDKFNEEDIPDHLWDTYYTLMDKVETLFNSSKTTSSKRTSHHHEIGDWVQVNDKEGNTTIIPHGQITDFDTTEPDGSGAYEINSEWYNENEYEVVSLPGFKPSAPFQEGQTVAFLKDFHINEFNIHASKGQTDLVVETRYGSKEVRLASTGWVPKDILKVTSSNNFVKEFTYMQPVKIAGRDARIVSVDLTHAIVKTSTGTEKYPIEDIEWVNAPLGESEEEEDEKTLPEVPKRAIKHFSERSTIYNVRGIANLPEDEQEKFYEFMSRPGFNLYSTDFVAVDYTADGVDWQEFVHKNRITEASLRRSNTALEDIKQRLLNYANVVQAKEKNPQEFAVEVNSINSFQGLKDVAEKWGLLDQFNEVMNGAFASLKTASMLNSLKETVLNYCKEHINESGHYDEGDYNEFQQQLSKVKDFNSLQQLVDKWQLKDILTEALDDHFRQGSKRKSSDFAKGDVVNVGNLGKGRIIRELSVDNYRRLYRSRYKSSVDVTTDPSGTKYYLVYLPGEKYVPAVDRELKLVSKKDAAKPHLQPGGQVKIPGTNQMGTLQSETTDAATGKKQYIVKSPDGMEWQVGEDEFMPQQQASTKTGQVDDGNGEYSFEEIEDLLVTNIIPRLAKLVNEWGVRDELKAFTQFDEWPGEAMATIDSNTALKILDFISTEVQEGNTDLIYEAFERLEHYIDYSKFSSKVPPFIANSSLWKHVAAKFSPTIVVLDQAEMKELGLRGSVGEMFEITERQATRNGILDIYDAGGYRVVADNQDGTVTAERIARKSSNPHQELSTLLGKLESTKNRADKRGDKLKEKILAEFDPAEFSDYYDLAVAYTDAHGIRRYDTAEEAGQPLYTQGFDAVLGAAYDIFEEAGRFNFEEIIKQTEAALQ